MWPKRNKKLSSHQLSVLSLRDLLSKWNRNIVYAYFLVDSNFPIKETKVKDHVKFRIPLGVQWIVAAFLYFSPPPSEWPLDLFIWTRSVWLITTLLLMVSPLYDCLYCCNFIVLTTPLSLFTIYHGWRVQPRFWDAKQTATIRIFRIVLIRLSQTCCVYITLILTNLFNIFDNTSLHCLI